MFNPVSNWNVHYPFSQRDIVQNHPCTAHSVHIVPLRSKPAFFVCTLLTLATLNFFSSWLKAILAKKSIPTVIYSIITESWHWKVFSEKSRPKSKYACFSLQLQKPLHMYLTTIWPREVVFCGVEHTKAHLASTFSGSTHFLVSHLLSQTDVNHCQAQ